MTCKAQEGGGTLQEVDAAALGQHLSFVTTCLFYSGEELPAVHQWASKSNQAKAKVMDALTLCTHKDSFPECYWPKHSDNPRDAQRLNVPLLALHDPAETREATMQRGTRQIPPHSLVTVIGCLGAAQQPNMDGRFACSTNTVIHKPLYVANFIKNRRNRFSGGTSSLVQGIIRIVTHVRT